MVTQLETETQGYTIIKRFYGDDVNYYLTKVGCYYQTQFDKDCIFLTRKEALANRVKLKPIYSSEFTTELKYWNGNQLLDA